MFTKKDLAEKVSDLDVVNFLLSEPLDKENPTDFYSDDLTVHGEMPIVTIRIPLDYKSALDALWQIIKENSEYWAGVTVMFRRVVKHGGIMLTRNEVLKEFKKLHELKAQLVRTYGMPDSPYYDRAFMHRVSTVDKALAICNDRLLALFGRSYEKMNFRAYPRWHAVVSMYANALNVSTYAMYKITFGLSLSTSFQVDPDAKVINDVLLENLVWYKDSFHRNLGGYIEDYEKIGGKNQNYFGSR